MKYFIYIIATLSSLCGYAQNVDSLALMVQLDSMIDGSLDFVDHGEFEKAFELNNKAEEFASENFGEESGAFGKTIFNFGRILFYKGEYSEAEKWYLKAQTSQEKAFGKNHFDYGMTLNNLAINYDVMGNYNKSESFYLDALSIFEKVVGKEDPQYARTLNNLAYLYTLMGRYDQSESSYLTALDIFEKARGRENATCAAILNNLGIVNRLKGDYKKSEPFFIESKDIRGRVLGKEHTNYAGSLNNLGLLYWQMGKYVEAESLYLESNAIWEKLLGKEHPDYIGSLTNLGIFYQYMGNHKKAESLYVEANNLREKVLGNEHPDYAWSLGNLGQFYSAQGEFEKAEPLFLEANKIRKKVLDPEHPDYAASLMNLGSLYYQMGRYQEAEILFLESQTIQEKSLGKEHPSYAGNWYNLGDLYLATKQYDKAKECYSEAISIQEKVLGKEHPDFVKSLKGQVILDWKLTDYEQVIPLLSEITFLNKSLLINAVQHLTEKELEQYILEFSNAQSLTLSLGQLGSENSNSIAGSCFDNCLFYKGFILNYSSQISQIADSHIRQAEIINQLSVYRRRLSAEYSKPFNERQDIATLEEKANTLEKELVRSVAGYGEAIRQVNWEEVQQALPENAAAIEFVHFQYHNPDPTDSIMYAALVLSPGQEPPLFIPLFEEKSLDSLVNLHNARRSDYVNDLYTMEERGASIIGKPQKSLYEMIWQPFEKELNGVEAIYYSPSGLLHRLNIGAIPIDEETNLADKFDLVQLGSTRQLVVKTERKTAERSAQLFGGIKYEADSTAMLATNANLMDNAELASRSLSEFDFGYTDTLLRGGKWRYLNGTDVEVAVIQQIMKYVGVSTELKKGYSATEEAFKAIGQNAPSPQVLHLATHGYFFPDPKSVNSNQLVVGSRDVAFKISEHPMIRSGLILAGGNHAWKEGRPIKPGMEDGILTAYEISQMNLSNTELVVLSACETGLGDIQGNEGVYGLQRAFKIAGAKYLIMSLWQVPDYQTQELMTAFYEKWLTDKMTIPEAFRSAQKEMREKYQNPYFWAGFVLVE